MKQYNNITIKIALIAVVLTAVSLSASKVEAQQAPRTMTIVPPKIEQSYDPGARDEGTLKVINESDTPLTFNTGVQDFIVTDSKGTPNLVAPNSLSKKFSAGSWIAINPQSFTIKPHETQELTYFLQVPLDAKPGGHFAAVIYTPTALITARGTGAAVQTQIGTLFSVVVNGNYTESATVSKFLTKSFQEYGPIKIAAEIKNMGDSFITPKGTITVTDMFGKTVATQNFSDVNIFPEASREYESTFGKQFMLGRYKATMSGVYGKNGALPLTAVTYIVVFPWTITLIIILAIIAIILGYRVYRKRQSTPVAKTPEPKVTATPAEPAK